MLQATNTSGSPETLADAWAASRTGGNNFDALRLTAASLVIFSHSFEIANGRETFEPLAWLTNGQAGFGRTAVLVFFVLSGFLLAQSWRVDPNFVRFVWKRFLRISPALIFVVTVLSFVIGPMVTSAPIGEYFASMQTWSYPINLGPIDPYDGLPGVFENNPFPDSVNQPLWTLKYEVMCYATLAVLGVLGLMRPWACAAYLVFLYALDAVRPVLDTNGLTHYLFQYSDLGRAFFAGALMAMVADKIPMSGKIVAAAVVLLVAATPAGLYNQAFPIFAGYAVLWAGLTPVACIKDAGRYGDISYGLYVWGWPVQQIMAQYVGTGSWAQNFVLAYPVTAAIAYVSWRYIEAPALKLKAEGPGARFRGR